MFLNMKISIHGYNLTGMNNVALKMVKIIISFAHFSIELLNWFVLKEKRVAN